MDGSFPRRDSRGVCGDRMTTHGDLRNYRTEATTPGIVITDPTSTLTVIVCERYTTPVSEGHPMTRPEVVYILAALANLGETDWTEVPVNQSTIKLVNTRGERIEWFFRFNSGDPMWFIHERPKRLRDAEDLNPIRSPSRH